MLVLILVKVAIMYSGGKDSTLALEYALSKGWEVRYLLSVKPTRTDCYLFHYATVEHTSRVSSMLGIKHYLISCSVANAEKEANLIRDFVKKHMVDALILGGTGLQETQLKSLQKALLPIGVEVFAAHAGEDHGEVFKKMLDRGYEILISQVASDGLMKWLGKVITKDNFEELAKDSFKYGFHVGFEGGYADTFVLNAPLFKQKIIIENMEINKEDDYCGHVVIKKLNMVNKKIKVFNENKIF